MTRWLRQGERPWNLSRLHRPLPTPAPTRTPTAAEWRLCQRCGSRNPHVGLFINRNNETRCVPDCATARTLPANPNEEVNQ